MNGDVATVGYRVTSYARLDEGGAASTFVVLFLLWHVTFEINGRFLGIRLCRFRVLLFLFALLRKTRVVRIRQVTDRARRSRMSTFNGLRSFTDGLVSDRDLTLCSV